MSLQVYLCTWKSSKFTLPLPSIQRFVWKRHLRTSFPVITWLCLKNGVARNVKSEPTIYAKSVHFSICFLSNKRIECVGRFRMWWRHISNEYYENADNVLMSCCCKSLREFVNYVNVTWMQRPQRDSECGDVTLTRTCIKCVKYCDVTLTKTNTRTCMQFRIMQWRHVDGDIIPRLCEERSDVTLTNSARIVWRSHIELKRIRIYTSDIIDSFYI